MTKLKLAIFASGDGSNAENIIRYFDEHAKVSVALVISNRSEAGVLGRAEALGIETAFVPNSDWSDEEMVLELLDAYDIDWIALSGFLIKVPDYLVAKYSDKMVNIHPALLPKFGGKGMYGMHVHKAVKAAGEAKTGITIHLVNEEYDKGKVVFQEEVAVAEEDDAEAIRKKVQQLEHRHFAKVLESLLK